MEDGVWESLGPDIVTIPREFTEQLFDAYASDFDQSLSELGYHIPQLTVEYLGELLDATGGSETLGHAVDLGCGTGACGVYLRPLVGRLAGCDIARNMVFKTKERGLYDDVEVADCCEYLDSGSAGAVDVVVAADLLIYTGDPEPLARAAARALREGGRFLLSIECLCAARRTHGALLPPAPGRRGFQLLPTERFAHDGAVLEAVAARHGLCMEGRRAVTIRQEDEHPIEGWIYSLIRRSASPQFSAGPPAPAPDPEPDYDVDELD